MKSTLFNMTAVLFTITLLAAAGVGGVQLITEEPIARARAEATREALLQVLPPFEGEPQVREMSEDELPVKLYTASAAGEPVGYAVETMTKSGFNGLVRLMVGFAPTGEVLNIRVVEQAETPGLGTKMADEENPLLRSFVGRDPGRMTLRVAKDGGDVEALTAATISSRAYVDAVARAYRVFCRATGAEVPDAAEAVSGATRRVDDASGATLREDAPEADEMEKGGLNE
ncbi:MAG: RnfABCDGE type electron transport complex subunit G [Alistipes sp.]|nr:RnfABCDGE type electron transport complex subunit G [Alistipes sp.]